MATTTSSGGATPAEQAVVIRGNVGGSVVVGNDNIVVNGVNGSVFIGKIQPTRTRRPPAPTPKAPDPFVGRTAELARLADAIVKRRPVTVSGVSGAGRTALMRAAANVAGAKLPGGAFRLDGVDEAGTALTIADLAQRLHDAAWETVPQAKMTLESAQVELGQIEALAIVDDVTLRGDDLERLAGLLPAGAVLIATREPPPDAEFADVAVGALDRPDAIALLVARAGLVDDVAASASSELDTICGLLRDWPEALVIAGRAIAIRSLEPADVLPELGSAVTGAFPPLDAVERAWAIARPALDANARQLLVTASALPGRTHDPALLRMTMGNPDWFDAAAATLESLDLLSLNSPRFRVPDGLRAILGDEAQRDAPDAADRQFATMLQAAGERALDPDFTDTEVGGLLAAFDRAVRRGWHVDAIGLGRAMAPHLVLLGLWDAWATVADGVRAAAERVGSTSDVAWAAHERGTRSLALGDLATGTTLLREALALRRSIGDTDGAAYTLHNLAWHGIPPVDVRARSDRWQGISPTAHAPMARPIGRYLLLAATVGALLLALLLTPLATAPPTPSPSPTVGPTPNPTVLPSLTNTPTVAPTAAAFVVNSVPGAITFDGPTWSSTLEVTLSGGVGEYRVELDGIGASRNNPAMFEITGRGCEPRRVTGTAFSGDSITGEILVDIVPTDCPTPTPIPLSQACVTFDDLDVGTVYGADAGQQSGDVIFETTDGIRVSVFDFLDSTGGSTFNTMTVAEPSAEFGRDEYAFLNNISVQFDYEGLPFVPTSVVFLFRDQGGFENFSVNGSNVWSSELKEAPSPIGGASWSWEDPDGDGVATGTLTGRIDRFLIGGQEFSLDEVCAFR